MSKKLILGIALSFVIVTGGFVTSVHADALRPPSQCYDPGNRSAPEVRYKEEWIIDHPVYVPVPGYTDPACRDPGVKNEQ
ncbi:MAG: hypothetical protein ABSG91_17820 [Syntrophobacteraceae bacterium]|jgi:hypothetical protein